MVRLKVECRLDKLCPFTPAVQSVPAKVRRDLVQVYRLVGGHLRTTHVGVPQVSLDRVGTVKVLDVFDAVLEKDRAMSIMPSTQTMQCLLSWIW